MPNTGKPSPNCHLCRQRRVKCDLARPQCQRCIKSGVLCPGYRDDQDLLFQHTDAAAYERRRWKRQQQQTLPLSATDTLEVITSTSVSSPSSASSWESDSSAFRSVAEPVPLVISLYSGLDFLPGLFRGVGQDHCLPLAAHVFTRAYVINRFRPQTDYRELPMFLGNAQASVQDVITSPSTCTSDSTIIALMMGGLERRSFVTSQDRGYAPETPWHIHGSGILSLMRARGDRQLYTKAGRHIFWTMHNMIQIQRTITNTPCPPEFDHWLNIIEQTLQPAEALFLQTGRYISSACSLLSRLIPIVRNVDLKRACAEYDQLLFECDLAELVMSEWMRTSPEYQRSARIKLHHMIILLANLVEHAPDCAFDRGALQSRRRLSAEIIAVSGRDIVDGIPPSLGGKSPASDPRSPATYLEAVRAAAPADRRLRAAKAALLRIGKENGILTALRPRAGGALFPSEALKGMPVDDLGDGDG
ncbi:Arginine metabolism regulation protein II [Colletotrichum shisoi]|uniref:Arginine metabolism regulation protein II n=1 Tax=Colletotrichum shisoi TaxID=2078593 RepID=A0A5Q4BV36_9PEZI|nr:Arginine metabolism regulation protein II [Colletotrichum shisoi]